MKILITGARGNFPTALIPSLAATGHELVLYDIEPMGAPEGCTSVQADIRDAAALTMAMAGCEAVVHAAALHGAIAERRNDEDFYGVNVTGTHNVLRAMLLHDIKNLVFSSTDEVYGDGMRGRRVMDESAPCAPARIQAMTKWLGEEMCRYYARRHGFHIAILRYGCFSPAEWHVAGLGRLTNWLDREDVAQANELAIAAVEAEEFACETFLIQCAKPFVDDDWPDLAGNAADVLERYYPGSVDLLRLHGLRVPRIHTHYSIDKAVTTLGYDPQHNFEQFLSRLRES